MVEVAMHAHNTAAPAIVFLFSFPVIREVSFFHACVEGWCGVLQGNMRAISSIQKPGLVYTGPRTEGSSERKIFSIDEEAGVLGDLVVEGAGCSNELLFQPMRSAGL
jgi:hypothetical protein